MINVADCAFLQLMWYPKFSYFFPAMIVLAMSSFFKRNFCTVIAAVVTHDGKNRHSQGSGPLGSGPIGPGSGYSVMPSSLFSWRHNGITRPRTNRTGP